MSEIRRKRPNQEGVPQLPWMGQQGAPAGAPQVPNPALAAEAMRMQQMAGRTAGMPGGLPMQRQAGMEPGTAEKQIPEERAWRTPDEDAAHRLGETRTPAAYYADARRISAETPSELPEP